jgi:type I restriction enzyme S subunit
MKKGWVTIALDEACNVEYGKRVVRKNDAGTKYPVYGGGGETFRVDGYNREDRVVVARFGLSERCTRRVDGRFFLNDSGLTLSTKNPASLTQEFLDLWTLASNDRIYGISRGTAQRNLDVDAFRQMPICYPADVAGQRRLVTTLDEAFEGIAAAKTIAERNARNAFDACEAELNRVVDGVLANGRSSRLGDVVTRLTNGYVGPIRNIYVDSGVPYLLARHVKNDSLQFDGKTYVSEAFNTKHSKSILREGDVLLVQSGHIGHSAVVPRHHEGHNCHAMIVISTRPDIVTGEFLSLLFNSHRMRRKFWEIRSGSTVPHLTCGAVKELRVPLPEPDAQRRLVAQFHALRDQGRHLAAAYGKKTNRLDELKASLLHQAFTGAL